MARGISKATRQSFNFKLRQASAGTVLRPAGRAHRGLSRVGGYGPSGPRSFRHAGLAEHLSVSVGVNAGLKRGVRRKMRAAHRKARRNSKGQFA